MAIWQYRLILIPEDVILGKYDVLPLTIPMELAEEFGWWSDNQPRSGFEQQIDLMLARTDSWSTSMRMWGRKHGDQAYVCYVDHTEEKVEQIAFRIDASKISQELVRQICRLATHLKCVLMTADYEILVPDESMVLTAINHSTARRFVKDPESTLRSLDHQQIEDQVNYLMRDWKKNPPK